jgi:S-adenosylmethionine-diacylgycerolhomoserine-N-methlytransferase
MSSAQAISNDHRAFLNRYYGISRHFYDLTRKYYLFGRDTELFELAGEDWQSLIEVGPGTGRNLDKLRRLRPNVSLGGVEACDEMLLSARRRCPGVSFSQGFAETADYCSVLGQAPERILFSYCLSMVQDQDRAIERAQQALAAGGQLALVDFADFAGLPKAAAASLSRWLRTFHVQAMSADRLRAHGFDLSFGPGRYFLRGRWRAA